MRNQTKLIDELGGSCITGDVFYHNGVKHEPKPKQQYLPEEDEYGYVQ